MIHPEPVDGWVVKLSNKAVVQMPRAEEARTEVSGHGSEQYRNKMLPVGPLVADYFLQDVGTEAGLSVDGFSPRYFSYWDWRPRPRAYERLRYRSKRYPHRTDDSRLRAVRAEQPRLPG